MKSIIQILLLLLISLSIYSCKKTSNRMTVVKNCTGIYVAKHGNSYRVCNYNLLEDYQDGDKINITIKKIKHCSIKYPFSNCMLVYPSKGVVEIIKIK